MLFAVCVRTVFFPRHQRDPRNKFGISTLSIMVRYVSIIVQIEATSYLVPKSFGFDDDDVGIADTFDGM